MLIGATGRPVAMRMGPKKRGEKKDRRLTATTSRMRRHAPFEPIDPYICMWGGVADVINCAKSFENPSKGFGAVRPRKTAFPIDNVHRPYNSVGTTVPHCDKPLYSEQYRYKFAVVAKKMQKYSIKLL